MAASEATLRSLRGLDHVSENPNWFLLAPRGFCRVEPSQVSKVYNVPAATLYQTVVDVVLVQSPRVALLLEDRDRMMVWVTQTTKCCRFVDDVHWEVVDLGRDRSALVAYSRSRVGTNDFGANRKRVLEWVERITGATDEDAVVT